MVFVVKPVGGGGSTVTADESTLTLSGGGVMSEKDQGTTLTKLQRGTNGQLIIGQTGADPAYTTVSGDATLAANGALTLAAGIKLTAGSGITLPGSAITVSTVPFRNLAGTTVYAKPALIQVAGPANYTTGGIPVDVSAIFTTVLTAMCCRQFVTATPSTIQAGTAFLVTALENGTDLFANGKFRLAVARTTTFTPAGTVAAPTVNLANGNATNVQVTVPNSNGSALAGGLTGGVGALTGLTGVQAPAFTGTAMNTGASELANGSTSINATTFEVLVWGIP